MKQRDEKKSEPAVVALKKAQDSAPARQLTPKDLLHFMEDLTANEWLGNQESPPEQVRISSLDSLKSKNTLTFQKEEPMAPVQLFPKPST